MSAGQSEGREAWIAQRKKRSVWAGLVKHFCMLKIFILVLNLKQIIINMERSSAAVRPILSLLKLLFATRVSVRAFHLLFD
jgi:hypothetical protein